MKVAASIVLSPEERADLEKLARGRKVAVRVAERARIVLLAAEGRQNREIAEISGATRRTVGVWRRRLAEKRIAGILKDAPRAGRLPSIGEEVVREIVHKTTQETPVAGTHWSTRSLAKVMGLSPSTIGRVGPIRNFVCEIFSQTRSLIWDARRSRYRSCRGFRRSCWTSW
jgi:transposase